MQRTAHATHLTPGMSQTPPAGPSFDAAWLNFATGLKNNFRKFEPAVEAHQREVAELKAQLRAARAEVEELRGTVARLQGDNAEVTQTVKELLANLSKLPQFKDAAPVVSVRVSVQVFSLFQQ
jgi:TolA-binding protein